MTPSGLINPAGARNIQADQQPTAAIRWSRFPKTARLLHPAEYRWVFADPVRSADALFTVLARPRPPGRPVTPRPEPTFAAARLGLAISRKSARRAVARNRIKRVIRESFRASVLCPALDCVVMCRAAAVNADNAALRRSLTEHWRRIERRLCDMSPG